jgi:hypothetical protein
MAQRTDTNLGFGVITKKEMLNGEERIRLRLKTGEKVSITKMGLWIMKDDEEFSVPWQEEHYHKGTREDYIVLYGWVIFIWMDSMSKIHRRIVVYDSRNCYISFPANIPHRVLMGPESKMVTTSVVTNTIFGNPEKKNMDWWRSDNIPRSELLAVEFLIKKQKKQVSLNPKK